jgi:predicted aspartyl protease
VGLIISLCLVAAILVLQARGAEARTGVGFRTVGGFLVIVPVTLNGAGPVDFVVDTGTNTTLIDVELAEQLKLKPVDRERLATLTGVEVVARYVLDSVRLGEESIDSFTVLGQRMEELHSLDPRIRGVLGLDFLARFAFLLDYHRSRIALYDPSQAPSFRSGTRVQIEVAESRILIPTTSKASVQCTWKLALDSGISKLLIFDDRIAQSPTSFPKAGNVIRVTTNMTSLSTRTVRVRDLEIGGQHLRDLQAAVLPTSPAIQGHFEDGLLPTVLFRTLFVNPGQSYAIFELD